MKRKSIKQQILDHLNSGFTLTYGQANTITKSQSGYRRMQEILKDNPEKYEYVRVKSENGGHYNVFIRNGFFGVNKVAPVGRDGVQGYCVTGFRGEIFADTISKTKKEAQAQIKKVVR